MHLLGPGGVVAAIAFGFRHGVDWDHLAALADLTGAAGDQRRAMRLSACYVGGHAAVVLLLGLLAIAFAEHLPPGIDGLMERIVGVTLVLLGLVLLQSVVRYWDRPRVRSRWMALHDVVHRRSHRRAPRRDGAYGPRAATVIGMVHGIGAETPTQLLLFAGIAAGGGGRVGVVSLGAFVLGLVMANTLIAAGGAFGFRRIDQRPRLARALSVCTAVFSIAIGAVLVFGAGTMLPPILGG